MLNFYKNCFLSLLFLISNSVAICQINSDTFLIAHKKSSPDYFTIFVHTEKSIETIEVYNGKFPNQSIVYKEPLKQIDTIFNHRHYIFIGKKSAVYKHGKDYYAEFTGYENEGYKTKLQSYKKEDSYYNIAVNCSYKVKQISIIKFKLDSILGHGNYFADFSKLDNENIQFQILNMQTENFHDSLDASLQIKFQEIVSREKHKVDLLKEFKNNIEKISFTTAKDFLMMTKVKTNIEKEIIYCMAEKQPALLIDILEKEQNTCKNEILKTFQEFGAKKESYFILYKSINNAKTNSETKQVLLKNLKKGKRHANLLKTVALTSGMAALIAIPITFIVLINL